MPHVIVYSSFNTLSTGPTYLANNDIWLADFLGATRPVLNGPTSDYRVEDPVYAVLDKLEERGFKVVASSSLSAPVSMPASSASTAGSSVNCHPDSSVSSERSSGQSVGTYICWTLQKSDANELEPI